MLPCVLYVVTQRGVASGVAFDDDGAEKLSGPNFGPSHTPGDARDACGPLRKAT